MRSRPIGFELAWNTGGATFGPLRLSAKRSKGNFGLNDRLEYRMKIKLKLIREGPMVPHPPPFSWEVAGRVAPRPVGLRNLQAKTNLKKPAPKPMCPVKFGYHQGECTHRPR